MTSTPSIRPPPPAAETIASTSTVGGVVVPTSTGAGVVVPTSAEPAPESEVDESAAHALDVATAIVVARVTSPRRPIAGLTIAQPVRFPP